MKGVRRVERSEKKERGKGVEGGRERGGGKDE